MLSELSNVSEMEQSILLRNYSKLTIKLVWPLLGTGYNPKSVFFICGLFWLFQKSEKHIYIYIYIYLRAVSIHFNWVSYACWVLMVQKSDRWTNLALRLHYAIDLACIASFAGDLSGMLKITIALFSVFSVL